MTRTEYLESRGFHYHEYDDTWIRGDYDANEEVYVLNFYNEYGYNVWIDNRTIFDEKDIEELAESLKHSMEYLKEVYLEAIKLEDK